MDEETMRPLKDFLVANYPISVETLEVCLMLVWRDCKYKELIVEIQNATNACCDKD